jgi:hypothetical protein
MKDLPLKVGDVVIDAHERARRVFRILEIFRSRGGKYAVLARADDFHPCSCEDICTRLGAHVTSIQLLRDLEKVTKYEEGA